MSGLHSKKLVDDLINREKWIRGLQRFIDVLRINIFVVNTDGQMILSPLLESGIGDYGSRLFEQVFRRPAAERQPFLSMFSPYGNYLEAVRGEEGALHAYAVPLKGYGLTFAYMIVGPVILNKRLTEEQLASLTHEFGLNPELIDDIHNFRVVSHVAMTSILELLATIAHEFIDMQAEHQLLHKKQFQEALVPVDLAEEVKALYEKAAIDELLVSALDIALSLTGAESGSIMMMDPNRRELSIRVSRGLEPKTVGAGRKRLGEGVSGIAAESNQAFLIKGTNGDARIKDFLHRDDIRESAVIPLSGRNRVYGVLNIQTREQGSDSNIAPHFTTLQHLSRLVSSALDS